MSVPFFLLLSVILSIGVSVTYEKMGKANKVTLIATLDVEKQIFELRQNQLSERAYSAGVAYASILGNRTLMLEDPESVQPICSVLDRMDGDFFVRCLAFASSTLRQYAMCTHADARLPTLKNMTAVQTNGEMIQDSFLVDSVTKGYVEPRVSLESPLPHRVNLSYYFDEISDPENFPVLQAYYDLRDGKIDEIPVDLYWGRRTNIRNIFAFYYPFATYDSDEALAAGVRDGVTFADVRIEGRRAAMSDDFDVERTGIRLMALIPPEEADVEPLVMSNNWGQEVVDRTYPYGLTFDNGDLQYLPVSQINDTLMRSVVRAVDMKAFTTSDEYEQRGMVDYQNTRALFVAWQYTTPLGMKGHYVMVMPFSSIVESPQLRFAVLGGAFTGVVVALTLLFFVATEHFLSVPLRQMGRSMTESSRSYRAPSDGPSTTRCYVNRGSRYLRLSEVDELLETYNDAMQQLAQLDTFIQRDARRDPLKAGCSATSRSGSADEVCALTDAGRLMRFPVTSVTMIIYGSSGFGVEHGRRIAERRALNDVRGNANRAAFGTPVSPLTPAMLEGLVACVQQLAEQHGGAVRECTPEIVSVYFYHKSLDETLAQERNLAALQMSAPSGCGGGGGTMRTMQEDAVSAALFALALGEYVAQQREAARQSYPFPHTSLIIDTKQCLFGRCGGEDTAAVARNVCVGRDPALDIGIYLPYFKPTAVITEETALLVQHAVCVIPIEALYVGKSSTAPDYAVVLYEMLLGSPARSAWQAYASLFKRAFGHMLRGEYAKAMEHFDQVTAIPDLEDGLKPAAVRVADKQDGAGSAVGERAWRITTKQLDRLMDVCVEKVVLHDTSPYVRRPLSTEMLRRLNQQTALPSLRGAMDEQRFGDATEDDAKSAHSRSVLDGSLRLDSSETPSLVGSMPLAHTRGGRRACAQKDGGHTRATRQKSLISPVQDALTALPLAASVCAARPTVTRLFRDNNNREWSVVCPSDGSAHGEGLLASSRTHFVSLALGTSGTLAMMRMYPFKVSGLRKESGVLRQQSTFEAVFSESLMSEYTVGYLGFCLDAEHGVTSVSEYFPGGNLREAMQRYGRVLPASVMTKYVASILLGLWYLHDRGVVHGDVRPENFLVGTAGRGKLKGFFGNYALACELFALQETSYVSPEVAAGEAATCASDIYCAGLVLLELLTMSAPWRWAPSMEVDHSPAELHTLVLECGAAFRECVARGSIVPALLVPEVVHADPANAALLAVVEGALREDPRKRLTAQNLVELL